MFLNAAAMENSVASNSAIEAAIVRGQGRKKPFLLVEVDEEHCLAFGAESREEVIDLLWPAILEVNFASTEATRLMKSLIIIADSARPFVRTAKGTIARNETLALYENEIELLYKALE